MQSLGRHSQPPSLQAASRLWRLAWPGYLPREGAAAPTTRGPVPDSTPAAHSALPVCLSHTQTAADSRRTGCKPPLSETSSTKPAITSTSAASALLLPFLSLSLWTAGSVHSSSLLTSNCITAPLGLSQRRRQKPFPTGETFAPTQTAFCVFHRQSDRLAGPSSTALCVILRISAESSFEEPDSCSQHHCLRRQSPKTFTPGLERAIDQTLYHPDHLSTTRCVQQNIISATPGWVANLQYSPALFASC